VTTTRTEEELDRLLAELRAATQVPPPDGLRRRLLAAARVPGERSAWETTAVVGATLSGGLALPLAAPVVAGWAAALWPLPAAVLCWLAFS
jgi:hypothetical protein